MIFIGRRPEDVASLRRPRRFFILRGVQIITATVFLVCLVNAAAKLKQNGRGAFARSFFVNVAVSLSLSFVFFPSVYWTGCELWDELLNHSAWVGWGNSHWWLAFLSFPVPNFSGSLELQVVSILFLFMPGSSFQSRTDILLRPCNTRHLIPIHSLHLTVQI